MMRGQAPQIFFPRTATVYNSDDTWLTDQTGDGSLDVRCTAVQDVCWYRVGLVPVSRHVARDRPPWTVKQTSYAISSTPRNMVSWGWWDWGLSAWQSHPPSVLWHCWLGHQTCKASSPKQWSNYGGAWGGLAPWKIGWPPRNTWFEGVQGGL